MLSCRSAFAQTRPFSTFPAALESGRLFTLLSSRSRFGSFKLFHKTDLLSTAFGGTEKPSLNCLSTSAVEGIWGSSRYQRLFILFEDEDDEGDGYYKRREATQRRLAAQASSPEVSSVHQLLADAYGRISKVATLSAHPARVRSLIENIDRSQKLITRSQELRRESDGLVAKAKQLRRKFVRPE